MAYHFEITPLLTISGWAGVDMFFVLSGFLVSGLLFSEYNQSGKIRPFYFLIRRGFKIYPLFYFAVFFHLVYFFCKGIHLTRPQILAELFFYQNYTPGVMGISWSLAVEEHFYFLLAILLFFAYRGGIVRNRRAITGSILFICCTCLVLRLYEYNPESYDLYRNYFPTHLRIDSLAFGVLISYIFIYSGDQLLRYLKKYKIQSLLIASLFIMPIFILKRNTFFVSVFGHTLLYIGYGIIMANMIVFAKEIDFFLKKYRLIYAYNFISWVGVYSFGIYLFHLKVGPIVSNWVRMNITGGMPVLVYFLIYLTGNICAGVFFSRIIERPFLRLREKYFPRISGISIRGN